MAEWLTPGLADLGKIATKADFGRELTRLREARGLAIREVARRTGAAGEPAIPLASLGDYFAGRHLPNGATLEKILRACEVRAPDVVAAWQDARLRSRRRPGRPAAGGPVPYRGLACFRPEDAAWFFGRGELTELTCRRAAECRAAGRPLAVVGPSGAGKSSLLRAGLIPALAGDGEIHLFTPGPDPGGELAKRLGDGTLPPGQAVIVDQFEEIFAPGITEANRKAFIEALFAAARVTLVAFGLRADFYAQALRYPLLAAALQDGQVVVGPMTAAELREAIVEPARLAKTSVEEALTELLLSELRPQGGRFALDPGALPLLSYALLATWDRHRSGTLTVADYLATGGISDAVKNAAEEAFGELGEYGRRAARRLLLRLVWVAQDAPDTRRRVPLAELAATQEERLVLDTFVAHRLLTVDDGTVEIAHEALLTAWPELRSWIDDSRADLLIRRRVTEAAHEWEARGRDPGDLLRGGKLAMARSLAVSPAKRAELTATERALLDASLATERADQQARRRVARRLRGLVAGLAAALVLTAGLTGYAFNQRAAAAVQRDLATSRQIATEVERLRGQDPGLAAQLSVAAYDVAQTPQARGALLESSGTPDPTRLAGPGGIVQAVALAPDHRLLAAVDDEGGVWLWDLDALAVRPREIARLGAPAYAVAFSPDGKVLAVGGATAKVYQFSLADPERPAQTGTLTGPGNTIYSLAFSPDGGTLAAGSADGNVWLWNGADSHGKALSAGGGPVESVTFGPGGGLLAAGTADGTVRLWGASGHPLGRPLTGPSGPVYSVAISPGGGTLAAGSRDSDVYLWDLSSRRPAGTLTGSTSWVNAVSFSPDGQTLAAGGSDDTVRLWDLATRTVTARFAHPGPVTTVAWDGQGTLISGAADGDVRLWQVPSPVLPAGSVVNGVAFAPHGHLLAVASDSLRLWDPVTHEPFGTAQTVVGAVPEAVAFDPGRPEIATGNSDGTVRLWRYGGNGVLAASGAPLRGVAAGQVEAVAFSPDGRLLVSGGDDGTVRLWNVAGPPRQLAILPAFVKQQVYSVAFSPDGQIMAAGSTSGAIRLWDIADPARPASLATMTGPAGTVYSVAFSPDGRLLAAGSADHDVYLWNVASPRHPVRDGPALAGPASYVYAIAFSPDGRMLAAGSTDDTVWLWTMAGTPALYATLTGPASYVYTVAFSPDGRTLAAGSADGTVRLWDTSPEAAAAGVCAAAGDPITSQEWTSYVPGVRYVTPCG
jgi:WD40 repeat protein/transcriptional regulator with XRE-family HTH domain